MSVNGEVISRDSRKIVQVGRNKGVTIPKAIYEALFRTGITGVKPSRAIFETLRMKDGVVKFLITPVIEIEYEVKDP